MMRPVAPPPDTSMRTAACVAAAGLLLMAVLSPIGYFYVLPKLVGSRDIVTSAQLIRTHQGLFLCGIFCFLGTFVLDIVVAWALYVFLRPVNASVSMLAAWMRLAYAAIAWTGMMKLVTVLRVLRTPDYLDTFGAPIMNANLQLLLQSFRYDWGFSILLFGIYLIVLGALVLRATYIPKLLGVLLVINGIAYLIDTLRTYLIPNTALPFLPALFFGELIFMAWLFIRGGKTHTAPELARVG